MLFHQYVKQRDIGEKNFEKGVLGPERIYKLKLVLLNFIEL